MNDPLSQLRRIVEGWLGPRLDRLALYPARVVHQQTDGTLDLVPDDSRISPCQGVPLRLGIPGATATVPDGGRVLLGYAGGDPRQPIATLWESGEVTVLAINGGSRKVARVADAVNVAQLAGTAGPWPVQFAKVPIDADGAPGTPETGPSVTIAGVVANAGGTPHLKVP